MLFDENKVKRIIKQFNEQWKVNGNTTSFLPKFDKKEIVDGIGKIAVLYNGDIELTKKLAILAVRTHNRITLITDNYPEENKTVVDSLNRLSQVLEYGEDILELKQITRLAFLDVQNEYDCVLVIGVKKDYLSLLSHLRIKSIFYQYGEYNIFVDNNLTDAQRNTLKEFDEYAYEHSLIMHYINISKTFTLKKEIDEIIHEINMFGENQIISIFTTVQDHSYYFLSELNCKKIVINSKPFDSFEFDENDFVFKKNIVME